LFVAGIDALHSGVTESSAPTVPTERSVPSTTVSTDTLGLSTTLSTVSFASAEPGAFTMMGSSPRIRENVAHAVAICAGANSGLATAQEDVGFSGGQGEWKLAAAAASEWALENLRALPRPAGDRVLLDEFFSAAQRELEALRRTAAPASAADQRARIVATHERMHWLTVSPPVGMCDPANSFVRAR
jgi:hypothetical protein